MKQASLARIWLTRSLRPFVFGDDYDATLQYRDASGLGLYVHIPFCRSICSFCPYCKVVYRQEQAKAYVEALLKEIIMVGNDHHNSAVAKKVVTSLYFGGGSPALLVDYIGQIIETIQKYFTITEGIGIELHPADVTAEILTTLKNIGISKISIGIQSFQETSLTLLGRFGEYYREMFTALKKVPFETVSMDLIFAIPGQTFETLKADIDTAFQNGANHVAIYPFIDFSFTKTKMMPMGEKQKRALMDAITEYFNDNGYVRESIWTFTKAGAGKYSSMTRDNFLGFGCSATTLLPDQFKINTFSVEAYIQRISEHNLPTALTVRFTKNQRMVYYLFWTAYTTRVDPKEFSRFFHTSLLAKYGIEFFMATALGLAKKKNGIYEMTSKGAYFYHYYEQFYTLAYIDKMWNVMAKEPFPKMIVIG